MEERILTDADLEEAKDIDRRFAEAWANKDLDAAMACFWNDPGLHVVLNGEVFQGPDELRARIEKMMEQHDSISVTADEITYVPAGDGVFVVGTARLEPNPMGPPGSLLVERWSDLRRKVDGRWVYVLDHATYLTPQDEGSHPAQ